jgi:hypothetical protein
LFASGTPTNGITTTSNYGIDAQTGLGAGSGTTTTDITIHAESPTIASGGTLTHHYGLYLEDQTVAGSGTNSDPWGVYEVAGKNYFGGTVRVLPVTFATLPTCTSGIEGTQSPVTDSTTNTWGATITGSGSDHVLGYCDGTNWTVMGK